MNKKKPNITWTWVEIIILSIILLFLLVLAEINPENPPNKLIIGGLLIWIIINIKKLLG